jgi:hypothetical protein
MNNFVDNVYVGIVEDINDPKRQGRIKVRVQNVFESIDIEDIPWAYPYIDPNGKTFNVPPVGKIVSIVFENSNIYMPHYFYTDKYNINLQDKLESLSDDEYKDFNALLFDHNTRIYTESEKLTIDYLINKITIDNESINAEIKDNSNKITLGSKSADQPAVLGDHFITDWFVEFLKLLLNPANMVGNLAAPILKPNIDLHIQKFLTNPKKYISSNVFIVDNNKVDKLERDSATSEVEHDDTTVVTPTDSDNLNNRGKSPNIKAANKSKSINNSGSLSTKKGVSVENTTIIDDKTKKTIQKNQESNSSKLKNAKSKNVQSIPVIPTNNINNNMDGVGNVGDAPINSLSSQCSKTDIGGILGFAAVAGGLAAGLTLLNKNVGVGSNVAISNNIAQSGAITQDQVPELETSDKEKDTVKDTYKKTKKYNENGTNSRKKYSIDKRGRKDILESSNVLIRNNKNIKNKYNQNYILEFVLLYDIGNHNNHFLIYKEHQ